MTQPVTPLQLPPSPLQELHDDRLGDVRVWLKREDLLHPDLPGNKWRKLSGNLAAAREQGHTRLVTFGGAYSNHIRAVAAAGRLFGFDTVGLIRGEEHTPPNWSLAYATAQGMTLRYLDRQSYRDQAVPPGLGRHYLIPPGGANALGVAGCVAAAAEIKIEYDFLLVPAGTGTTLAGLAAGLTPRSQAIGVSVLKGHFLPESVAALQHEAFGGTRGAWSIDTGFHFGGYAKTPPALLSFVDDFQARHGLALDPVYTGKMMTALFARVADGTVPAGSAVVAVITGTADILSS